MMSAIFRKVISMFDYVDRILVAVRSLDDGERNYSNILAATKIEDFESKWLNSRVRRMQLGATEVELCEPLGAGVVQTHLDHWGEGLLYGGVSTPDPEAFTQYLANHHVRFTAADERLYLEPSDLFNTPLVVSKTTRHVRTAGPIEFLYELTMVLNSPWQDVAERYADGLRLKPELNVGINNERFGYVGTLVMFDPDRLDRIELSEAHDPSHAMGRFAAKRGDAMYMCYVQTDDIADIIRRLEKHEQRYTRRSQTPVEHDGIWIHPNALNGVLLGVSRQSHAWLWSGRPDRVQALEAL